MLGNQGTLLKIEAHRYRNLDASRKKVNARPYSQNAGARASTLQGSGCRNLALTGVHELAITLSQLLSDSSLLN